MLANPRRLHRTAMCFGFSVAASYFPAVRKNRIPYWVYKVGRSSLSLSCSLLPTIHSLPDSSQIYLRFIPLTILPNHFLLLFLGIFVYATDAYQAMVVGQFKSADCSTNQVKSNVYRKNSGCKKFATGAAGINVSNTGTKAQKIQFFCDANCGGAYPVKTIKPFTGATVMGRRAPLQPSAISSLSQDPDVS